MKEKLQVDGRAYHHIFDRTTGYPIDNQLASLTIVSSSPSMVKYGRPVYSERALLSILEKVEQENGIKAFVTENHQIFYSSGLSPEILS